MKKTKIFSDFAQIGYLKYFLISTSELKRSVIKITISTLAWVEFGLELKKN